MSDDKSFFAAMPRPLIDLSSFREEIELCIQQGYTQPEIRTWLSRNNVRISKNTLSSRIIAWGTSRYARADPNDPALIDAIKSAFDTTQHNDEAIADNLKAQGFDTSTNQVREIRISHNLRRRNDDELVLAAARTQIFSLVQQALHNGLVRCYGRGLLRTYLRINHSHHAREDDVRDALAILDEAGTDSRRKGPDKRHQGKEYITPGPDFLWCCDGHDKFRNYGIEIYAGVDAYSRRIQWIYIGNSNRRAVGILRQVITTVQHYNRCPSFYRSDRGKEVLLAADAHYSFYIENLKALGICPDDEDTIPLRNCYMFGTSTANIKIESTWMRMIRHQTKPWLVCC